MTAHPIPEAALAHHIAIVGKTGSGKTFAAKGMVEGLLARGQRTIIVDPTGVWWGLRLAPAGTKASRHKVVIFGGRHADLPLDDGEQIARILGGSSTSAILDVQQISVGQRTRFFTSFAEALLRENRGPLHLVLDEAHLFAPQGGSGGGFEQTQLLHATNNLVSLGRSAGLRITLISQRPAKLHKDALTQVETLVAMRVISPQDRKAVADWLAGAPDASRSGEIMSSLASLKVGEGWIYAPELGVLDRARFPTIETFDSGRPLEAGEAPALKPLDVAALQAAIAAADGRKPDKTISRPSNEGAKNNMVERPASAAELTEAEARGEARGLERGVAAGWKACARAFERDVNVLAQLFPDHPHGHDQGQSEVSAELLATPAPNAKTPAKYARNYADPQPPVSPSASLARQERAPPRHAGQAAGGSAVPTAGPLNSAGRKMLAVLDTNPPVRRSWQQIATLAGLKARGGHFNAGKKGLVGSGHAVEASGLVAIARPSKGARPERRDPAALVEMWAAVLSGAAPKILRVLFSPSLKGAASRERVAQVLELQPRGGHWNAAWKELRENGLVTIGADDVARLTELFSP